MKDIKNYLVNEAKAWNFKDIKYTLITYYKPDMPVATDIPLAFLIEHISEINDKYYDWGYEEEDVDEIIEEVKKLNVNECYIHESGENDFEVISRIH